MSGCFPPGLFIHSGKYELNTYGVPITVLGIWNKEEQKEVLPSWNFYSEKGDVNIIHRQTLWYVTR